MGDRVEPISSPTAVNPPVPQLGTPTDSNLRRASDFLSDNVRIGNVRTHYDKYRRYTPLYMSQMFVQLTHLYEALFRSQWQHFRRFMDTFPLPAGLIPTQYASRVYISTWMLDLYCSIREATRAISPLAFNEKYSHELIPWSTEYDAYLVLLNSSLRPTHIQQTPEDTLYIPTLCETYDWSMSNGYLTNPFGVTNFVLNDDIFYGLLQIMRERHIWKLTQISTHTLGRPCWLFDWHEDTQVCAWFPREGNYNDSDVTLAYILGVACTPKLGPRDVDDWQFPEDQNLPMPHHVPTLERLVPRRFYGAYEVRTLETEDAFTLPEIILDAFERPTTDTATTSKKPRRGKTTGTSSGTATQMALATASTPAGGTEPGSPHPTFVRYRIIDWCYQSRVILNMEWHTRTGALKVISFN